jgi:hypothetical protein
MEIASSGDRQLQEVFPDHWSNAVKLDGSDIIDSNVTSAIQLA